jgi:hypothetical protein
MVWKAEKLVALGLTGKLYYIVLLPLGLSVAGFLFGVVQSYATFKGKQLDGNLVLGGPIVGFFLVVVLGWSAEVLRARSGVGVEVGTASRVWQSHIYKDVRSGPSKGSTEPDLSLACA